MGSYAQSPTAALGPAVIASQLRRGNPYGAWTAPAAPGLPRRKCGFKQSLGSAVTGPSVTAGFGTRSACGWRHCPALAAPIARGGRGSGAWHRSTLCHVEGRPSCRSIRMSKRHGCVGSGTRISACCPSCSSPRPTSPSGAPPEGGTGPALAVCCGWSAAWAHPAASRARTGASIVRRVIAGSSWTSGAGLRRGASLGRKPLEVGLACARKRQRRRRAILARSRPSKAPSICPARP